MEVPGAPSSAAFPGIAAILVPGAQVRIPGVSLNPTRTGVFECLAEMGARLDIDNRRFAAGEPVGDLTFHGGEPGTLRGIDVPAGRAPRMIDEYPILAAAAAAATGTTTLHGLGELRVKESDRLGAIANGLAVAGIKAAIEGDTLMVHGHGRPPPGGGVIDSRLDHRIAMAFLVLGLSAVRPVKVAGAEIIETSFPGFVAIMNRLGARITSVNDDG